MERPVSFVWPAMLILLLLVPVCVGLYVWLQQRRQRRLAHYGGLGLVRGATGRGPGMRHHVPPLLFMVGLTLLLVALARPQMVVSLPRIEGIVLLAFDVSASMAADDLDPTRMEAAKAAAQAFVEQQPSSVLIGVVSFSDSGFIVQVPTNDQEAVLNTIDRLSPERGTSLANGILASLNAIAAVGAKPTPHLYTNVTPTPTPTPMPVPRGMYKPAAIVLLTDGENNESPDPLAAAATAADRGVRIHTVGIGSAAGADLEVEGFLVHTQLNEELLQEVSARTGGTYYRAESTQELREIYEKLNPGLVIRPEEMEVTSILAGASMFVLLVGGALSLLWFSRVP
jgi:Ca-activated chloride channel family protein